MNLVERLAGLPGVQREVDQAARKVARTAKALAAGHGSLAGDIKVERVGPLDVDVVLEHEAALAIEVGHVDKVFKSGWVPGLHIMRNAANLTT
ncbi:DUF5403 family protein [Micropruina sp.]|uniref:DUF5403 family protein n=1 Tax=Micropruina sp. TaxID=2737536 RepID=UPI0039E22DAE